MRQIMKIRMVENPKMVYDIYGLIKTESNVFFLVWDKDAWQYARVDDTVPAKDTKRTKKRNCNIS
jgi:hypothetical protein